MYQYIKLDGNTLNKGIHFIYVHENPQRKGKFKKTYDVLKPGREAFVV